jgi:CubicO group peptidase (beta-lactamase class C family)
MFTGDPYSPARVTQMHDASGDVPVLKATRARLHLMALLGCALLLPVSALAQVAGSGVARPVQDRPSLDAIIPQRMAEGGLVGLAAAVIVDGKVVWRSGYGFADRETGRAFTTETVMNIASISKTMTGAAMMRAAEQRRLSLDASVDTFLPFPVRNPHRPGQVITLRQLATHTSGITDRWSVYAASYHFDRDAPQPLGAFLKGYFAPGGEHYSPDNFLDVAPGTHREYSNIGAGLAGYIVERATGQPLEVYTREQFFIPLGMTHTRWFMSEAPMTDHVTLYMSQDDIQVPVHPYSVTTWPDGGLRTSVDDLSKFFIALLQGGKSGGTRVLEQASVEQMLRLQFTPEHKPDNVDLAEKNSGLFWQTKFNTRYVGHGGSDPGLKTEMLATPDRRIGVILFSNTSGAATEKSYVAILQALFAYAQEVGKTAP